jgi:UDP-glucuronate 4-epimerase
MPQAGPDVKSDRHLDGTTLVTGVGGFIGREVAVRLTDLGRRVVGIDRQAPAEDLGYPVLVAEIGDTHRLYSLIRSHGVEDVVHCAGISGPMLVRDQPHAAFRVNALGTADLLEAARICSLRRVIYCSSCAAYGDTGPAPITENAPLAATDVYGASKAAADLLVQSYAAQYGVDGLCLRFCWVYGPRRTTTCVIRTMLIDALAGRPTRLSYGSGFYRQFIYIDDVVDAILASQDAKKPRQRAYNVTGGERLTLDDVAQLIRAVVPAADISLAVGPDPEDYHQELFDISAAHRDLGWRPKTPLRDGIARYAQWLRGY